MLIKFVIIIVKIIIKDPEGDTMSTTKVYIIEYRFFDKESQNWISKISQEGYSTYTNARNFCEERATNAGRTDMPMYFQNTTFNGIHEEYYIHEVIIK